MLTAFLIFMASRGANTPPGSSRSATARSRDTPGKPRGGTAGRPPKPNHFLSVRIDNAQTWGNVSNLQSDIVATNEHLRDAAIPVQDLHLTFFVMTLHEQDGSLQRARETLARCRDILLENGLCPREEPHPCPPAESLRRDDTVSGEEACPLTLSFRGLGNFRNKVLFARLLEDEQAARFRRLVSALHRRFSEASLLAAAAPSSRSPGKGSNGADDCHRTGGSDGGGGGSSGGGDGYHYEFTPHLTVMKTSKLGDRRTLIPPASYDRHDEEKAVFGEHAPAAVELSSMLEREETPSLASSSSAWEPRPYYKCEQRLALLAPKGA